MKVTIAGICCDLEGLEDSLLGDAVLMRYSAFLTDDTPQMRVRVCVRPPVMGELPDTEQPMVAITETSANVFEVVRSDNPFEGVFDLTDGTAEVTVNDNMYCFDSFLRILYSLLLASSEGILLHSAAVATAEKAALLVGISEAGKTTLCSLGFSTVLSDELVAVRKVDGRFIAYSTPFWGEFVAGRVREQREVGAVYLLRKGPRHEVRPASVAQALFEALGCVFFFGPTRLSSAVLGIAGELVESRLRGEFYFKPTSDVVAFLESEVEQHVA